MSAMAWFRQLPPSASVRCTVLDVRRFIIAAVILAVLTACAAAQQSEFRWLNANADSDVLERVQTAFSSELAPDQDPQSRTLPMTVKFIERVGLRGNSALVILGEKESKTDPFTAFRAFTIDLQTKAKWPVRSAGVEWFWMWRVEKVTHLTSADDTDIVFQFLSCTECEWTRFLAAIHYTVNTGTWELREWSKEDGAGLMIGSDIQYGDDGYYYYDCLHAIADVTGDGLDDVAIRCRESVQPDPEKPLKRVRRDETLLYTAKDGKLARTVIGKTSEYTTVVRKTLCATKPSSPLCQKHSPTPSTSPRP
jgi:hypothetical protein